MDETKQSCSEVLYILEHLEPEDKAKIPKSVFQFFKKNSDPSYEVELDASKPLAEQKLKDETKGFLQIIADNYFKNK